MMIRTQTGADAPRVRLVNYLAYGSNDVLGAGSMVILAGWVLLFYTRFCGLTPAQAAIIFGIARVIDAVASPLIGHISDNFRRTRLGRRLGRRRIFILAAIPLLPSFALVWLPNQTFLYYLVSYVFFELVYAMEIIPYETLAAEMSPSYTIRAKFAGSRLLFGQASAILAGFAPVWLISYLGRDSADTFLWMGIIFTVLFMTAATFVYLFTWERPVTDVARRGDHDQPKRNMIGIVYRDLRATLKVRAFRLHLGMYLGGYLSQDVFNALFTFFVIFALSGSTVRASAMMGWMYVVQLFAVAGAIHLTLRRAPAQVYRLAAAFFASGLVLLIGIWIFDISPTNPLIWAAVILAGLGRGALNYVPWATYNYMPDVDEIMTGKRREGSFAGVMTFVRKASQAIAVSAVGMVMQVTGFNPKLNSQSIASVHALILMFAVSVLTILGLGVYVSFKFRLDKVNHSVLTREIEHLRSGNAEASSSEAMAVVEDLSGVNYSKLWGKAS
jgi:oligogalacturonide transporter